MFFVWTAAWGKILTIDHLRRRGFIVWIGVWCCLCRCSGESVDHLLLHCGEVSRLWSFTLDCLVFVGFNLRGLSIFWPVGGIGFLGGGGGENS